MQFFRLTMECGHVFENSAVDLDADKPYKPDYVGQEMPARCCEESHIVKDQKKIPYLTGRIE